MAYAPNITNVSHNADKWEGRPRLDTQITERPVNRASVTRINPIWLRPLQDISYLRVGDSLTSSHFLSVNNVTRVLDDLNFDRYLISKIRRCEEGIITDVEHCGTITRINIARHEIFIDFEFRIRPRVGKVYEYKCVVEGFIVGPQNSGLHLFMLNPYWKEQRRPAHPYWMFRKQSNVKKRRRKRQDGHVARSFKESFLDENTSHY